MRRTRIYTGIIKGFIPSNLKRFPNSKKAQKLAKQTSFGIRLQRKDSFPQTIIFTPHQLVHYSKVFAISPKIIVKPGMRLSAKCKLENGLHLKQIQRINGHPFKDVDDAKLNNKPKRKIKKSASTKKATKASNAKTNTHKARQLSASQSTMPSSVASQKASSMAESKALSSKVSSASASKASLSASQSDSFSASVSASVSASTSASESQSASLAKKAQASQIKSISAGDNSLVVINKKLNKIGKADKLFKANSNDKVKQLYQKLVSQPASKDNEGLRKIFDSEDWHKFVIDMETESGKDFNKTLNREITNSRMNYALMGNIIPDDLDEKRVTSDKKPKKKRKLHDIDVF